MRRKQQKTSISDVKMKDSLIFNRFLLLCESPLLCDSLPFKESESEAKRMRRSSRGKSKEKRKRKRKRKRKVELCGMQVTLEDQTCQSSWRSRGMVSAIAQQVSIVKTLKIKQSRSSVEEVLHNKAKIQKGGSRWKQEAETTRSKIFVLFVLFVRIQKTEN